MTSWRGVCVCVAPLRGSLKTKPARGAHSFARRFSTVSRNLSQKRVCCVNIYIVVLSRQIERARARTYSQPRKFVCISTVVWWFATRDFSIACCSRRIEIAVRPATRINHIHTYLCAVVCTAKASWCIFSHLAASWLGVHYSRVVVGAQQAIRNNNKNNRQRNTFRVCAVYTRIASANLCAKFVSSQLVVGACGVMCGIVQPTVRVCVCV